MTLHILPEIQQGTPEWHDQRRGLVTASVVGKLVTVGPPAALSVACPTCNARPEHPCVSVARKTPTAIKSLHESRMVHAATRPPVFEVADNETSRGIVSTLIAERLTGYTEDTRTTWDMFRGIESEPLARDLYSEHYAPVREVGFLLREEEGWSLGYSPDGLVADDGLIEVKAPRAKTHLNTILADEVPAHYLAQCQAGLLVSGRKWIDFVSFCGGMPLYVKRVHPDPAWFAVIEAACRAFEDRACEVVTEYRTKVDGLPIADRIPTDLELVF